MNKDLPAIGNVFLGLLALSLGISAIAITQGDYTPANVCAGIWGGVYVLSFGILLKIKKPNATAVMAMALFAVVDGLVIIGIHSWSINEYQVLISNCEFFTISGHPLCGYTAVDALLITSGILIVLLNGLIAAKAKSFAD